MIDWRTNKIHKIAEILEKMGHEKSNTLKIENIKSFIMGVLANHKKNVPIQNADLNTILSNIENCDHHDLVRIDNIITRIWNKNNGEYQWGSVVQDLKWKL